MVFITLYAVNFFRTLIIIGVVYFAIKFITRQILPFFIQKKFNEMQQKINEQQKQQQRAGRREGDITINYGNKRTDTGTYDEGEYVDFEEVE